MDIKTKNDITKVVLQYSVVGGFFCWFLLFNFFLLSLLQLYWAVVLLQRECRSEITYSPPNPNPNCFVLDERVDPGQN